MAFDREACEAWLGGYEIALAKLIRVFALSRSLLGDVALAKLVRWHILQNINITQHEAALEFVFRFLLWHGTLDRLDRFSGSLTHRANEAKPTAWCHRYKPPRTVLFTMLTHTYTY